ncbi:MAG: RhuM family protein [Byssovorax sp.]
MPDEILTRREAAAPQEGDLILYRTADNVVRVEVLYEGETFWLDQRRMAELFGVDVRTVSEHLGNIHASGELPEEATLRKFRMVRTEGNREVRREIEFYNLDAIISVGYRVSSAKATQFRIWATQTLRDFIVKGFVLDDERLKLNKRFGKDYFDELLERIREIRASERRFYLKITDISEQCSGHGFFWCWPESSYDPMAGSVRLFGALDLASYRAARSIGGGSSNRYPERAFAGANAAAKGPVKGTGSGGVATKTSASATPRQVRRRPSASSVRSEMPARNVPRSASRSRSAMASANRSCSSKIRALGSRWRRCVAMPALSGVASR